MLDRIGNGLCPAGDLQLGKNIADMGFHRGDGDHQGFGDLLVALTLHNQVQHFPLSFCQFN